MTDVAEVVKIHEPLIGYRRAVSRQGVAHVMQYFDAGPGAVHRYTLCGRMGALVLVGYGRPKPEWAAAKASFCDGVTTDPTAIERVTCPRCTHRARRTTTEGDPA